MIQQSVTSTGIRVVTEAIPGARSVCTGVWVGVGSRDEPAELAGVSHFLEHLLFKGTPQRSAQDIARSVDRVGGEMNAFTTKEYTAYYTRLPAGHLEAGVELLGDVLSKPSLADADVESERQVILEELAMDEDTPDDRVHTLLGELLFSKHPLGRETAGERSTVAAITADDVREFFGRWYRPANLVVAAAGDIDHADVMAHVERSFGGGDVGVAPEREAPTAAVRDVAVMRRAGEQAHLAIGYRAFDRRHPDRDALEVLNHVVGGGMSSRLIDEIRERRGLAYSVWSSPVSYADAGAFTLYVGTSPDHLAEVVQLVDHELTRLLSDGITDDELEVAVGYLGGSYLLAMEDASSRMGRLGGQLTVLGEILDVDEQLARYRAITRADVQRVAETVLSSQRAVAVVGPTAVKAVRQLLQPA
ncbi:MAG: peptidase [Acidimicrobiia bacterium]|nr:peptidase [Acidimicrobiia bacterium]